MKFKNLYYFYDIPLVRWVKILIGTFPLISIPFVIITSIIDKTFLTGLLVASICLAPSILLFLFFKLIIYLATRKSVIFKPNCLLINGNNYEWYSIKLEPIAFNTIFDIQMDHNLIKLEYFDKTKKKNICCYIKGKTKKYNNIMMLRNK